MMDQECTKEGRQEKMNDTDGWIDPVGNESFDEEDEESERKENYCEGAEGMIGVALDEGEVEDGRHLVTRSSSA